MRFRLTSIGYNCDSGCDWTWARAGIENNDSVIVAGNRKGAGFIFLKMLNNN